MSRMIPGCKYFLAIFLFEPDHHTTMRLGIKPIRIHFMDFAQITTSSSGLVHNEIYTAGNEPELPSGKF